MLITLVYIVACLVSKNISLNLGYLLGAILLDLLFDYPTVKVIYRDKE